MIRVTGPGGAAPTAPTRKAKKAGPAFKAETTQGARAASGASASAPAETLSALIALQSAGGEGAQKKSVAAAQRVLDLLDRLRMGLLDGDVSADDLNALALASKVRHDDAASDGELSALLDEISLRARVELAKRGA